MSHRSFSIIRVRHERSGQSLIELLIAITIGVIMLIGAVLMISSSTRTNADISRRQIATGFARGLMDNVRVFAESGWGNIAGLAPGPGTTYFLTATSSPFVVSTGTESVAYASTTYNRHFYVEPVFRNGVGDIDLSGAISDPSTKRVTIVYGYGTYPTSTLQTYLTRWRSSVLGQTDWSGGPNEDQALPAANSRFVTSSNITIALIPGSLLVSAVPMPQQKYLMFDGTNDYITLSGQGVFNGLAQGTVEAWVLSTADTNLQNPASGFQTLVGSDSGACAQPFNIGFRRPSVLGAQTQVFEIWGSPGGCVTSTFDMYAPIPDPRQWNHVAYTVDGTGNRIYINGVQVDPTYVSGNAATQFFFSNTASSGTMYNIGGSVNIAPEIFYGGIDEVRVWSHALSQAEIQANMYNELLGNEAGLVGYWTFDEGAGQVALDGSITNQVGFLGSTSSVDGSDPTWTVTP